MSDQPHPAAVHFSSKQIKPFEDAFLALLDPNKLEQFADLWAEDKDKALQFVGLRGGRTGCPVNVQLFSTIQYSVKPNYLGLIDSEKK